jgi:methyltransferase (TIGR00027 family)
MKPNQSSTTAENNAILRLHESMRPENERICNDPYAEFFLPDQVINSQDRNEQIRQAITNWETQFPGVSNAIVARTRFIDDCLEAAIVDGIRQLVILGAGYDTRAMRFKALKESVNVFELDHPNTQKKKLERIEKYLKEDLSHIRYISIDFSKEDLAKKLFAYGYDETLKTLFVWEGVTYYIPAAAVDSTLSFISHHSPSRSSVIFDYFPSTVADGTTELTEARALREGLRRIGEEIIFGISPDLINEFMQSRGFSVIQNLTGRTTKKPISSGVNKNRTVSEMFIFVQATFREISIPSTGGEQ